MLTSWLKFVHSQIFAQQFKSVRILVLLLVKRINNMSSYTNIITNMNETYDVEYNPYRISQRRPVTPSHFSVVLCPSISNKLHSWQVIWLQKCGPLLHCSVAGCIPKEIWSHLSRFVQYRLLLIVSLLTGGCYSDWPFF